jgi:Ca2+-binding RTX toxin-like protein
LVAAVGLIGTAGVAFGFEIVNVTPLFTTADNLGGAPSSLSLHGDTLVAGTRSMDGLVTVFRNTAGWTTEQVIPPAAANAGFGEAVDVHGGVLAAANNSLLGVDAVHVFRRSGVWELEQPPITNQGNSQFGHSVSVGDDLLAVGAPFWTDAGGTVTNPAVYLYEFDGSVWAPNGLLQPSFGQTCGPTSFFGYDLDLVGNVLVVGAQSDALGTCPGTFTTGEGSVSVWVYSSGTWAQSGNRLRASDPDAQDHFGTSVATTGNSILVGANGDDAAGTGAGAAYLFEQVNGVWTETKKFTATEGQFFGSSVAIADTGAGLRVVVGGAGSAYVFERTPSGAWTETRVDMERLGYTNSGNLGTSVAALGSLVALGGTGIDPQGFVIDSPVISPQPVPDSYVTQEDTLLSALAGGIPAGVLDNDADPRGDGLTARLLTAVENGTLVLDPNGSFVYTPDANFNGSDSFVYEACDPDGICSSANVDINVTAVPDPPLAVDDTAAIVANTPVAIDVLANDSDPDLDSLSISAFDATTANDGTVSLSADDELVYNPPAGFVGADTFSYTASDGGLTDSALVTVTVEPDLSPPSADDDTATTPEDAAVAIDVLANDLDNDGTIDPSSVTISTPPASGTASVQSDGTVLYTPASDFNGSDQFVYQVCDNDSLCDTALVTVSVTPVNDAPIASDDAVTTEEGVAVTIPVMANDTAGPADEDQALEVAIVTFPTSGLANVNLDGSIIYTPDPGFSGTDSFTYSACDSEALCDEATVTVTVEAASGCDITGTDASEELVGTAGPDLICALGGNDTIDGLGGNDTIYGGSGNDVIEGGAGNDLLHGEDGHDRLVGGIGNDFLDGGPNPFVVLPDGWRDPTTGDRAGYGESPNGVTVNLATGTASGWGTDTLVGIENVFGSAFNDVLTGNDAPNVLWGDSGSDVISGSAGMDRIYGGDDAGGADSGDSISGGTAADWIDAGSGADSVTGNQGDDVIFGGQGNDDLQGNDGNDEILGGLGGDLIFGFAGNDSIWGEEGNDTLFGGAGNDRISGGSGADLIGGGFGNDRLWAASPGTVDASSDALNGNEGRNTCTGSLSVDSFVNCNRIRREPS